MIVDIKSILPRHNIRCPATIKYWARRKTMPALNVCYVKDIDKFVLLNGHHRYYALKAKKTRYVDVVIDRVKVKTTLDKYGRPQA